MQISITVPSKVACWFDDIAKAMYSCCVDMGYETEITHCETINNYDRGELVIVLGAHYFVENNITMFNKPEGVKWAWYQLEQLPYINNVTNETMNRWHQMVKIMEYFDYIIVEHEEKKKFLSVNNVESHIINCGYHPSYDLTGDFPDIDNPTFDVFFYGAITSRRRMVIEEILNRKMQLHPLPARFLNGRDRFFALRNSKVVLNVHMNAVPYFEKPRLVCDCFSNAAFVVSEHIEYPEEFIPNEHYIDCDYKDLVDTVEYWVKSANGNRKEIQNSAHDFVKNKYTLKPSVQSFLNEVFNNVNN